MSRAVVSLWYPCDRLKKLRPLVLLNLTSGAGGSASALRGSKCWINGFTGQKIIYCTGHLQMIDFHLMI